MRWIKVEGCGAAGVLEFAVDFVGDIHEKLASPGSVGRHDLRHAEVLLWLSPTFTCSM